MQIAKRTMNWLPRTSLYNEAENARLKRKAYARSDIEKTANLAGGLIGGNINSVGEQINLTLRIAAARIQATATAKREELLKSTDFTA